MYTGKYDDIIDLPRHVSPSRGGMKMCDRAAQFAPYAALTGYGDKIAEEARMTRERIELCEDRCEQISLALAYAFSPGAPKTADVTYFVPDGIKSGGEYRRTRARLVRIDEFSGTLILDSGEKVSIADIYDITF